MEAKIREVNKKLLRTFERLNYHVQYDDHAEQIIKLNGLVGHVYRLFVQRQLEAVGEAPKLSQTNKPKRDETIDQSQTDSYKIIINHCCQRTIELAEVFSMLLKILNRGNLSTLRTCLSELQTIIEQIQSGLLLYEPDEQSARQKLDELKKMSLKSAVTIMEIPIKENKSVQNCNPQYLSTKTGRSSTFTLKHDKSMNILEDLKEEVETLNQALLSNNQQYNFEIQKYTEKLAYLDNIIQDLSTQLYHAQKNEETYFYELENLRNDKYADNLLIKNMARKIRKLQQKNGGIELRGYNKESSSGFQSKWGKYFYPKMSQETFNRPNARPLSIESCQNRLRSGSIRKHTIQSRFY